VRPDGTPRTWSRTWACSRTPPVTRDDGAVFVHLHPMGTVSMVAQQLFEQRARGDTAATRRASWCRTPT
jgi:hypothetical protein